MDASEQYIKMCRKAVEIQKLWKPIKGNWVSREPAYDEWADIIKKEQDNFFRLFEGDAWTYEELCGDSNIIWLPQQDQLQKILYSNVKIYIQEIVRFYFGDQPVNCYNIQFPEYNFETMEQLLLTLIMKLKYNKTWNGKDWISVEQQNPPNT